jgi:hypothetical protein
MGMYGDQRLPRSASGERGEFQDGACFASWQCETYVLKHRRGAPTRQSRWHTLDLPLGGNVVHYGVPGQIKWTVSLLKLDSGKWVCGWAGCWVAGPHYLPYEDRESALYAIVLATIRQAWVQYRTTGPQRHLIGIEAEELDVVTSWAVGLMDKPEPRRIKREQRLTLMEKAREA